MPTPEERAILNRSFIADHTDTPPTLERPVAATVDPIAGTLPATVAHDYTPTSSGRAARGELEDWVKEVCDVWLIESLTTRQAPCTPPYIADEIAKTQGIRPPSIGAVDAVLKRWVRLNFAIIAAKPTKFDSYTASGIALGLDGCKEKAKRLKKSSQQAAARGVLR